MRKTFVLLGILFILVSLFHLLVGSSIGMEDPLSLTHLFLTIRIPRFFTAAASGAAMGLAGVLLQSFFRNPMADPFVLGIHSGAAFGTALATLLFQQNLWWAVANGIRLVGITSAAFLGALSVTFLVSLLSVRLRSRSALLVFGLMLGYGLNALISLMMFFSSPQEWELYFSWNFASFAGTNFGESLFLVAVTVGALLYGVSIAKKLNLYRAGGEYATSMGVNVSRLRWGLIALSSLLTAAVTAFCGPVAFVGIAAPRLIIDGFRLDDHRALVVLTPLAGALLTLFGDVLSKTPGLWFSSLPLNPVLSFLGLPFVFIALMGEGRGGRHG